MDPWPRVLALSIAGAIGVNARYWLALAIDRAIGPRLPWATFAINVSGAFALGMAASALLRLPAHHPLRLTVMVGFLGGYTTFSTFALETRTLWDSGLPGRSLGYAIGSVAAGVLAVSLGLALGRIAFGTAASPADAKDRVRVDAVADPVSNQDADP